MNANKQTNKQTKYGPLLTVLIALTLSSGIAIAGCGGSSCSTCSNSNAKNACCDHNAVANGCGDAG